MRTIIRSEITFAVQENGKVAVFEEENYLGEVSTGIYNILCVFNGESEDEEIIAVLATISNTDGRKIFRNLISKFSYILTKTDHLTRELIPVPLKDKRIDLRRVRRIVPGNLTISLTRNCHMRCIYCYAGAHYSEQAKPEHTLPMELIKKTLDEMQSFNCSAINFTGGEPFLRADLFDILDYCTAQHLTFSLSTKKLLTDAEIERLTTYSRIMNLQISIDALDDRIQERMIGYPEYSSNMLQILKKLVKKDIDFKINSVVTSLNIDDIPNLLVLLDQIGVKQAVITPYADNLFRTNPQIEPTYEEYRRLKTRIDDLDLKLTVTLETFLSHILEDPASFFNQKICSLGENNLLVGPTGEVSFCERLLYHPEFSLGNIREKTLLEMWNSEKLLYYYSPPLSEFCGTQCGECIELEYCVNSRGICYVDSMAKHGKAFAPDSVCKYSGSFVGNSKAKG